ncbi:MAG: Uma2 family endonuclease [Chloroflexota bacterium]|nr:Uma2 family endonuclease [Chloroflexota bacterium]
MLYVAGVPSLWHNVALDGMIRHIPSAAQEQDIFSVMNVATFMPGCDPVHPDFMIVRPDRKHILQEYIQGVPDALIEILSEGNEDYDNGVKRRAYAKVGVPE